jgi:hypothetical protein
MGQDGGGPRRTSGAAHRANITPEPQLTSEFAQEFIALRDGDGGGDRHHLLQLFVR